MGETITAEQEQIHNAPDSLGYVHVYTGNGKGKTTAALGLALRATGAGLHVWIGQFVKGMEYSEIKALRRFGDMITVRQFGRGCFIRRQPDRADIEAGQCGFNETKTVITSGEYDVVILDEINIATHFHLLEVDDLCALIDARPPHVELILTGRCADKKVLEKADLVTEMHEVKHYFNKGVFARCGIER